jgi:hypothetical protein
MEAVHLEREPEASTSSPIWICGSTRRCTVEVEFRVRPVGDVADPRRLGRQLSKIESLLTGLQPFTRGRHHNASSASLWAEPTCSISTTSPWSSSRVRDELTTSA